MNGSAKHLIDWLDRSGCRETLNPLITDAGATISEDDHWQPYGKATPEARSEMQIPRFCEKHFPPLAGHDVLRHWLPESGQGKGSTWDLLSTCTIDSEKGLLLVEAKAHETELNHAAKSLNKGASEQSKLNHKHISNNVKKASTGLNRAVLGRVSFSIEKHYQLANRLAWAWKLAESGVPVVLLYLGFTGDTYFNSDYLRDGDHWQRIMGTHLKGVVPLSFPGTTVPGQDGGSFTLLVKSLPVIEVSKK